MVPPSRRSGRPSSGGDGARPRREPRHVVPAISFAIQADFHGTAQCHVGRLWDVSRSGACLLFPARHPLVVGESGSLILHPPTIGTAIETRAELLWIDRLRHSSYAGLLFLEAVTFEDTFLAMLLRRSGGGGNQPLRRWNDRDDDQLWLKP